VPPPADGKRVELLPTGTTLPGDKLRVFRTSFVSELVAAVLFIGGPLVVAWLLRDELGWPESWLGWLAAPFVVLGGALWLLVVSAVLHSLAMSLRRSNWKLAVSREGLFLNLRSYRNAHLGGDHPTVLRLLPGEVERAGRVTEVTTTTCGHKRRTYWRRFLELQVPGVDLAPLCAALSAEASEEAPERSVLGVRSRTRFQDAPVVVPEQGVVWVEWSRGMLDALDPRIAREEPRRVRGEGDEGQADERPLEERVDALVARGQRLRALQLVRDELSLERREARDWLDGRSRQSA